MKNRYELPFRLNCEGYFIDKEGDILARKDENGIIIFPGGGVSEKESVSEGMIRETFEETGVIISDLKELGQMKIIWGSNWAKTEKQKHRYEQFQGDDMYFFLDLSKK